MAQAPAVERLVTALKEVTATTDDPREVLSRAEPLVRAMAEDRSWVRPEFYDCDEAQGFGIHVLNEEPDHSLFIEAIAWLPGRGVAPHDHQTWGIVVGIDGVERNTTWMRRDDGSRPGHAELEAYHQRDVGPGESIVFMPNDIHSVHNDHDRTSLSLHVYGHSLGHVDRSQFDPEAKTVVPCPKRVRNRSE